MSHHDPRAAILKRRALFVGSALAAAGCTPNGNAKPTEEPPTGQTGPTAPVVSVAPAPSAPQPTTTTKPEEPPPKTVAGRPSYDVPEGVSDEAKKRYDRLHEFMKESHARLDPALATLPDCTLRACEPRYRQAATVLADLRKDQRLLYICPGKSDEAKAFQPHYEAHKKHLQERLDLLDNSLRKASGDEKAYQALVAEIAMSKPIPCLSFACPDW